MRWTALVIAAVALTGCQQPHQPAVKDAWVRLAAVPGRPAAGYFTIAGADTDTVLTRIRVTRVGRAELHESMANGMRALPRLSVPANSDTRFAPGGRHVMLYDVDPALKPGDTATVTLGFTDGRTAAAQASVVGAADPAP